MQNASCPILHAPLHAGLWFSDAGSSVKNVKFEAPQAAWLDSATVRTNTTTLAATADDAGVTGAAPAGLALRLGAAAFCCEPVSHWLTSLAKRSEQSDS